MSDQRTKAGNIGDLFKHAVLPELVLLWLRSDPTMVNPTYAETHAGFYTYDLCQLKTKSAGAWSGERAWSLGILEQALHDGHLGVYGAALLSHLQKQVYPGSIRLVEFATRYTRSDLQILGFDLGREQVNSYPDVSEQLKIKRDDGYRGLAEVPDPRLIFCDPFWTDPVKEDEARAQELLLGSSPAIVWYPLKVKRFRSWLKKHRVPHAELRFRHYKVKPWAGQDLRGSGLAYSGLRSHRAAETISRVAQRLVAVFKDKRHGSRRLDLDFSQNVG